VSEIKDENYTSFLQELILGCPLHKILEAEKRMNDEIIKFIGIQVKQPGFFKR
jgi:hypothetical protein